MTRAIFPKVMWVGKATTFCVGLAVVLAVVFGIGTAALAAVPGDPFKLGRLNTMDRLTTLAGSVSGPLFKVDNNGSGPALALETNAGTPPMKVNAGAGKVANFDADELDGKTSGQFLAADGKASDSAHADRADTAASADNANTLDGNDASTFLGTDQKAADADKLDGNDSTDFQPSNPCPSGTLFHEGACIETAKRGTAGFPNAEAVCLQAGRRLPTVAELQTFRLREGHDFNVAEYTSNIWLDANGSSAIYKVMIVDRSGAQDVISSGASTAFRCVAAPNMPTPNDERESAAQSDLRNAAAAATACSAGNDGSYANCGSVVQLQAHGYSQNSSVTLQITTATATRWAARAQHTDGGSAYQFDTATGEIEATPRFQ